MKIHSVLGLSTLVLGVLACGDSAGTAPSGSAPKPSGSAAGAGSAKPAASGAATATATAAATATATATSSADAAPTTSGSAPPAASGAPAAPTGDSPLPADLSKLVSALKDTAPLPDPKLVGFEFLGPKGAKLESAPVPGEWSTITADGHTLAFYAYTASDGGDTCPKLADVKGKVKGAKDVLSVSEKLKPWGKKSMGEKVDFWMFEEGGKVGFYALKDFGGKDKTQYCCAPGSAADGPAMKGRLDKAAAETLAGVCLSLTLSF